jgi:hypothetical protein
MGVVAVRLLPWAGSASNFVAGVRVAAHNRFAATATIKHVVNCFGELDPSLASHAAGYCDSLNNADKKSENHRLTPTNPIEQPWLFLKNVI